MIKKQSKTKNNHIYLGFINLEKGLIVRGNFNQEKLNYFKQFELIKNPNEYFSNTKISNEDFFKNFKDGFYSNLERLFIDVPLKLSNFINFVNLKHSKYKGIWLEGLFNVMNNQYLNDENQIKKYIMDFYTENEVYLENNKKAVKNIRSYLNFKVSKDEIINLENKVILNFILFNFFNPFLSLNFVNSFSFEDIKSFIIDIIKDTSIKEYFKKIIDKSNLKEVIGFSGIFQNTEFEIDLLNKNCLYDIKNYTNSKIDNGKNLHQLAWYLYIVLKLNKL